MKKGLRSRIRALQCPTLRPEERACRDLRSLQQSYTKGFDWAVQRALAYIDHYAPLPEMLLTHIEELCSKQVADIHGDGQSDTVVANVGFILACNRLLKFVHDEHGDEIERARAIERAEDIW